MAVPSPWLTFHFPCSANSPGWALRTKPPVRDSLPSISVFFREAHKLQPRKKRREYLCSYVSRTDCSEEGAGQRASVSEAWTETEWSRRVWIICPCVNESMTPIWPFNRKLPVRLQAQAEGGREAEVTFTEVDVQ